MTPNKKSPTPVKEVKKEEKTTKVKSSETVESKVTDVGTALADIQKRADARKKIVDEGQKKLNDARRAVKERGSTQTGSGKLQGLASLKNTLGTQYLKET
jgi:hypothetical protein